jgi:hypothetical protein
MGRYKIVSKGVFERTSKFEERLNQMAAEGWRVVSSSTESGVIYVIMERER